MKKTVFLGFCILPVLIFSFCNTNKKKAVLCVENYIKAYITGDERLLKTVLNKELLKNFDKYANFFKSPYFKEIREEIKTAKVEITEVKKTVQGYSVSYKLIFKRYDYRNDVIPVIREGEEWKITNLGQFCFE